MSELTLIEESGGEIVFRITAGTALPPEVEAALNAADGPSAANAFMTQTAVGAAVAAHVAADDPHGDRAFAASVGYPLPVPVNGDWSDAPTAYADIAARLRNLTVPEGQAFAIVLLSGNTLAGGANDSAILLLKRNSGVLYVNYYKEFYAPPTAPGAPDVSVVAVLPFEPVGAPDLLAHDEERPAHFLTTEIVEALNGSESPYDFPSPTNWVVTEAEMQEHRTANDPHGDRAFTASALNEHESLTFDPHGDRAYTTSSIATHASAPDQHGDRAYADAQMAAHVAADDPHGDRAYASTAMDQHTSSSSAHPASNITYAPGGNLVSLEVNGALDELESLGVNHNASLTAHPSIRSGIVQPLDASHFASLGWNNQGTSVASVYDDHVVIQPQITGGTTTYGMRCLEKAVPDGDADFEVIGAVMSIASTVGTHWTGIYVRYETMVYTVSLAGYTVVRADTRTTVSQTTAPSNIAQYATVAPVQPTWFKIKRVGGTMTFHVSMDGQTWIQFASVLIGTVTFTHFGFFAEQRVASGWSAGQLNSLSVV